MKTAMQYCPSCETELPGHARFCGHCGLALSPTTTIEGRTNMKQSLSTDGGKISSIRLDYVNINKKHSPPTEVEPFDIPTAGPRIFTFYHKVPGRLPMPVQLLIATVLARASDPNPEESYPGSQKVMGSQALAWGWLPILTLTSALGVLLVAYAYTSARNSVAGVEIFYWLGLLLIFAPPVTRHISPKASRFERIGLICVVTVFLYLVVVMFSPLYFDSFDNFVHWRTADDIARSHHLFSQNALLPASPFYPGLEIVTNAFSILSGLSTFYAAIIVIGIARLVLVLSLFLLYEQVTASARIGGIATLLYMTNANFVQFDAGFDYESLALPLATLMLFIMAHHEKLGRNRYSMGLAAVIVLAAVVVTHHMTDYVSDGFLILWTAIYAFQHPTQVGRSNLARFALFGIIASLAWISLKGNPVVDYLSGYWGGAVRDLTHVLTGSSGARHFFVDYSGERTPLWKQLIAISSVALTAFGLPFGLLCLWQRYRYNALMWMLGIVSLFYPLSHLFRLTNFGSEIADRAVAFLFIAIACVLAIFITQFLPTRWLSWKQNSLITSAIAVMFLGGVVLGGGPPWQLLPGPYLVIADERSIEPEGIQAAVWARSYLGPDNRIVTDRINRLLMGTYGEQRVVTGPEDKIDVSTIFFSSRLGPHELTLLRDARARYLVVDLRLSTGLPRVGFYFDQGEPGSFYHTAPISREALAKFNNIPKINRVFDSGDIVIYDVGVLTNAP